jgi:hypothetical protein
MNRDEDQFLDWCKTDLIVSFDLLKTSIKEKLSQDCWQFIIHENIVAIYKVDLDDFNSPSIICSLTIDSTMNVTLNCRNSTIPSVSYIHMLCGTKLCDRWTKLDGLINFLNSQINSDISCNLQVMINCFNKFYDILPDEDPNKLKFSFLLEQLSLCNLKQIRYSFDTLLFASKIYFTNPSGYRLFRDSGLLKLPHPKYLDSLINNPFA